MVVRHLKYTCDIDRIVTSLKMKVIPTQCIYKGNKYAKLSCNRSTFVLEQSN